MLQHRSILLLLVRRDLRVRYADSYLGYLWTILDPLLMALVFWFIFTVLFSRGRFGLEPYIVFLLVALLPWNWCNGVIGGSTKSITGQHKLVRSTRLPREVWPLRLIGSKFLEMIYSVPIVIVFAAVLGVRPSWYVLTLPIAIVIQGIFLIGMALIVSPVTVLIGDLERLIKILLRIFFYLTPIIYSATRVFDETLGLPTFVKVLYSLNPMVGIINLYRAALFPENFVGWWLVGVSAAVSLVLFAVGWWVFARLESAVLKEL